MDHADIPLLDEALDLLGQRPSRNGSEPEEVFNETVSPEDKHFIDRLFPQVRLSSVSSSLIRDTRDEPLGPSRGTLVGIDTE